MRLLFGCLLVLAVSACKQKNSSYSSAVVVPKPISAPAFFFKKFKCRVNDTTVVDLYLQQQANNYNSDTTTFVVVYDTRIAGIGYCNGMIKPVGGFVFSNLKRDTIAGWFSSDTTIYISRYSVSTSQYNSLVFNQQSGPCSVSPNNYYKKRLEISDGNKLENNLCDSFFSEVNLSSLSFISNTLKVSDINRLLETHQFWGKSIKSAPAPSKYVQLSQYASIVYFENNFVTVELYGDYNGCGAAHHLYNTTYLNYSFVLGDTISLTDIVRAEAMDKLTDIVRQRFVAKYSEPEEGWSFHLTSNFAVLRNGLLFKYQVYEMGPFATGDMEVFVPYSDITPLLNYTPVTKAIVAHF